MHGPRRAPVGPSLLPLAPIPERGPSASADSQGRGCGEPGAGHSPRPAPLEEPSAGSSQPFGAAQIGGEQGTDAARDLAKLAGQNQERPSRNRVLWVGGCCQLGPLCVRLAPCWYVCERALGCVGLSEPVLVNTRLSVSLV